MEEQLTTGQVIKKWGVIYGAISAIVSLVPILLEYQSSWLFLISIALAIAMYILANKEFKTENGGLMSFGEGFKMSFGIAAIAGVIRGLVSYVYTKFIDPEYIERARQISIEQMRSQGLSEQQIEQSMSFTSALSNPEVGLVMGFVVILLGALIWGAIVSAIMKNGEDEY
ncbi:MAG: hypothetical protein ACI9Z3_002286 [Roseivirga sp.]|jgi:hypothetical protein